MPSQKKTFRRSSKDLLGVTRSLGRSHGFTQRDLYREEAASAAGKLDTAGKFLKTQVFGWLWHYLKTRFGGRWKFATYSGDDRGVYPLQGARSAVKVSVAGDWATGSEEAFAIGQLMGRGKPDFTIHLGDVYYVGTKQEVLENMLGGQVDWPRGAVRTFALNGNHEMYARGKAYFENLLPQFKQRASYFALRNDHWLVIGLDTGYNSVGIPILEKIFRPGCGLRDELVAWLREDVKLDRDTTRGVVLLSHHQYYSAFEKGYEKAARQLEELIKRPVLWIWGHEHRFALYGKVRGGSSALEAYGRCLGHGGMPVEDIAAQPDRQGAAQFRLVLYDHREKRRVDPQTPLGYNGFGELVFDGPNLTIEYRDIDDTLVVREKWQVEGGGALKGVAIEKVVQHPQLIAHAKVGDAIA